MKVTAPKAMQDHSFHLWKRPGGRRSLPRVPAL